MPRNRNHWAANNFEFPQQYLKVLPQVEKVDNLKKSPKLPSYISFAEQYNDYSHDKVWNLPSSSDFDNISEFDIVSFGKSSSSSISWSDEFDLDATQRVKNELELFDNVLQGNESIPPHYNRDEYEQWMKTFPHLSVFEKKDIPTQSKGHSSAARDCDRDSTSPEIENANCVEFAVLEETFQKIPTKLYKDKVMKRPQHRFTQMNQNDKAQKLTKRFDNMLRISPVLLQEHRNRSFYLDLKQPSSHSVYKSDKLSSKWIRGELHGYTSLPFITKDDDRSRPNIILNGKTINYNKSKDTSKMSSNKSCISLPPIKAINIPSSAQCRSISVTPRKYNEHAVVSAHIDSLKRRRKVVTQNKLESIRNVLNYSK